MEVEEGNEVDDEAYVGACEMTWLIELLVDKGVFFDDKEEEEEV